jgi:hypothetical protein
MSDLPIACSLTAPELQARRTEVLQKARAAALEVKDQEDGFAYRFPSNEFLLADLSTLIQLEHRCCPFLKITLTVEAGDGPVWLELTGPPGTKEFLNSIFEE